MQMHKNGWARWLVHMAGTTNVGDLMTADELRKGGARTQMLTRCYTCIFRTSPQRVVGVLVGNLEVMFDEGTSERIRIEFAGI